MHSSVIVIAAGPTSREDDYINHSTRSHLSERGVTSHLIDPAQTIVHTTINTSLIPATKNETETATPTFTGSKTTHAIQDPNITREYFIPTDHQTIRIQTGTSQSNVAGILLPNFTEKSAKSAPNDMKEAGHERYTAAYSQGGFYINLATTHHLVGTKAAALPTTAAHDSPVQRWSTILVKSGLYGFPKIPLPGDSGSTRRGSTKTTRRTSTSKQFDYTTTAHLETGVWYLLFVSISIFTKVIQQQGQHQTNLIL